MALGSSGRVVNTDCPAAGTASGRRTISRHAATRPADPDRRRSARARERRKHAMATACYPYSLASRSVSNGTLRSRQEAPGAVHPAVIADSSRFVTVFRAMRRLIHPVKPASRLPGPQRTARARHGAWHGGGLVWRSGGRRGRAARRRIRGRRRRSQDRPGRRVHVRSGPARLVSGPGGVSRLRPGGPARQRGKRTASHRTEARAPGGRHHPGRRRPAGTQRRNHRGRLESERRGAWISRISAICRCSTTT